MSITSRIFSMEEHVTNAYDELQGLGADLTNVNKNIENISMVLDDIYDSMPKVSGEGTSLTLDDTRVGKIKSTLKGNTSQTGTPTPDNPIPVNVVSGDNAIQIQGPNYFDYEDTNSVSSQITTDSEGWISCTYDNSGSTSTQYFNYWTNPINVKPSTNYLLVLEVKNVSGSGRIVPSSSLGTGITQFATTSKWFSEIESNNVYTFPITSNDDLSAVVYSLRSFVQFNGGQSGSITFRLSVLNDTTITANTFKYYPYSLGLYPINLPVENLCNGINQNVYLNNSANQCGIASNNSGLYIPVNGGNYTISTTSTQARYRVACSNGVPPSEGSLGAYNGQNKDNTSGSITIDTTGYTYLIVNATDLTKIQIEKGSKANSYTPFGTTPIEMCKMPNSNYIDGFEYDEEEDKWYKNKEIGKVVLDGTQNITLASGTPRRFNATYTTLGLTNIKDGTSAEDTTLHYRKCDHFIYGAGQQTWGRYYLYNNWLVMLDSGSVIASASDLSTWLSNNNTAIYYVLATPIREEITYQPLIDQLNLLEKAMSKDGQTNISQVNNDLPFIISASALKEWQESTSLNSTLSMVNPLSLGNTLNTQENNTQPIEVDNIEPLEEEENEES